MIRTMVTLAYIAALSTASLAEAASAEEVAAQNTPDLALAVTSDHTATTTASRMSGTPTQTALGIGAPAKHKRQSLLGGVTGGLLAVVFATVGI